MGLHHYWIYGIYGFFRKFSNTLFNFNWVSVSHNVHAGALSVFCIVVVTLYALLLEVLYVSIKFIL